MKRSLTAMILVLVFVFLVVGAAYAATVSTGGVSLTYPDYPLNEPGLASCDPANDPSANTVSLNGIPEGADVTVHFLYSAPFSGSPVPWNTITYNDVNGGNLVVPVSYPDVSAWPGYDAATGERSIGMGVQVSVLADDGALIKLSAKWWVRCAPPPPQPPTGNEGCTPGYWRQDQHYDSWAATGYSPSDDFEAVFGVDASFSPTDLGTAVALGGGGENALARHAVAALLNAANPDVAYAYTAAEVIAGVQDAYASGEFEAFKDALDAANNAGCPIN